ncbi:HNH endonuclease [Caballeronia glebae]|uniref:HNH endonuclease n=1 Tax=Caballeronia glebae TaxID=1777143 RepID=UPI0038B72FD3
MPLSDAVEMVASSFDFAHKTKMVPAHRRVFTTDLVVLAVKCTPDGLMSESSKFHKNLKDLTGLRFGRLVVVHRHSPPGTRVAWWCRCDCGREKAVASAKLVHGSTKSCGCLVAEIRQTYNLSKHNFVGQVFGRLTVTERTFDCGRMRWRCLCSCGGIKLASTIYLKSSDMPSCGCAESESAAARRFVDITGTRFGKLVAVRHVGFSAKRKALWQCTCDCGGEIVCQSPSLRAGRTISCGCARSELKVYMTPSALADSAAKCARRRARKRATAGSFTAQQIAKLFDMQRGRCASCGELLGSSFHRDHRVALSRGGSNDISNIDLLCPPCNRGKGTLDPVDWARRNGRLL